MKRLQRHTGVWVRILPPPTLFSLPFKKGEQVTSGEKEREIERLARKICGEKCRDFGNKAAVDYLIDDQWEEWIPEAIKVVEKEKLCQQS